MARVATPRLKRKRVKSRVKSRGAGGSSMVIGGSARRSSDLRRAFGPDGGVEVGKAAGLEVLAQSLVQAAGKQGTFVDEGGVQLHQGGAGADALPDVIRGLDAADGDQDQ